MIDHGNSLEKNENLASFSNCENINNCTLLEGMTSISALINGIRAGVNPRRIELVMVDRQKASAKAKELSFLRAVANEFCFQIEFTDVETLNKITTGSTHGGIVAFCTQRSLPCLDDALSQSAVWNKKDGFFVMLEGIEDPYNFGYAVRSCYAAGADGIILSPRNWMGAGAVVARSSAGTSELLPIAISDPLCAVETMRQHGYRIACAGIRSSVPMQDADLRRPLVLVVGGEKRGISRALLDCADQIVRIDYGREFRGSLSAAAAVSVLAFEALRQNSI